VTGRFDPRAELAMAIGLAWLDAERRLRERPNPDGDAFYEECRRELARQRAEGGQDDGRQDKAA
jgi:hypothetical protein